MVIDLVKENPVLNTPTVIQKQCTNYEVIAWMTGKRVPLSLGHISLPERVDIDKLIEVLNADI